MADRFSQEVFEVAEESPSTNTRLTQEALEVLKTTPATNVRMTQEVLEVVLGAGSTLIIACPVNNKATLGLPYSGQPIVSGGTPPYTYEIV